MLELHKRDVEGDMLRKLHAELVVSPLVKEMVSTEQGRLHWSVFETRLRQLGRETERKMETVGDEDGLKYIVPS